MKKTSQYTYLIALSSILAACGGGGGGSSSSNEGGDPVNNGDPNAGIELMLEVKNTDNLEWKQAGDIEPYINGFDDFYEGGSRGTPYTLHDENFFVLASAQSLDSPAYAKFHACELVSDMSNPRAPSATLTMCFYDQEDYIDEQGETQQRFAETANRFDINIFNVNPAAVDNCYDIETASGISCDGDEWDINFRWHYDPQTHAVTKDIQLNGGDRTTTNGYARAYGPYTNADEFANGNPDYSTGLAQRYATDVYANAFNDYLWYGYQTQGERDHSIWATFRTYVIDTDNSNDAADLSDMYKVQIVDYYDRESDAEDKTGHLTVRYSSLANEDANAVMTINVDASSREADAWTYLSFNPGADASVSQVEPADWDIAFGRVNVKVNDGRATAIGDDQAELFTDGNNDGPVAEKFLALFEAYHGASASE